MKQWIYILLCLGATSYAGISVHYGLESHSDNGYNDLLWNKAVITHEQENVSQSVEWGWFQYEQSESVKGIYAYSGEEISLLATAQGLRGLWWGQVQAGFQGNWSTNALVFQVVGARAIPLTHSKWTPRIAFFRKPLAYYSLPLFLSVFEEGASFGTAFSMGLWDGDVEISWNQWNLTSDSTRFQSQTPSLPEPRIIRLSHYSLRSFSPRFRLGYVLSGSTADRTTQIITQNTPVIAYEWVPAAAPILSGSASLLVEGTLLQLSHFTWQAKSTLPLLSGQERRWESQSVTDWGTASLVAQSKMSLHSGSWQVLMGILWQSTPWNHMQYFDKNAYQEWLWSIDLQTSF